MIGLWTSKQTAMLGLEVQGTTARPKILILKDGQLRMCCMEKLNLNNSTDLQRFLKLIVTFISCVIYELTSNEFFFFVTTTMQSLHHAFMCCLLLLI